jgi:hypothetical protein
VPVNEFDSSSIKSGDRVDVLVTGNATGSNDTQTKTVLPNVRLLAIGSRVVTLSGFAGRCGETDTCDSGRSHQVGISQPGRYDPGKYSGNNANNTLWGYDTAEGEEDRSGASRSSPMPGDPSYPRSPASRANQAQAVSGWRSIIRVS